MGVPLCENNLTSTPSAYWTKPLNILKRAVDILEDPFHREQLPDYDWESYEFRIFYYGSFLAYSLLPKDAQLSPMTMRKRRWLF